MAVGAPATRAPTSVGWAGFVSAVSGSRITLCALALIAVQVCLNSYVVSNAFFQLDDFAIGGLVAHPLSLSMLFQNYGGHLQPGGFLIRRRGDLRHELVDVAVLGQPV